MLSSMQCCLHNTAFYNGFVVSELARSHAQRARTCNVIQHRYMLQFMPISHCSMCTRCRRASERTRDARQISSNIHWTFDLFILQTGFYDCPRMCAQTGACRLLVERNHNRPKYIYIWFVMLMLSIMIHQMPNDSRSLPPTRHRMGPGRILLFQRLTISTRAAFANSNGAPLHTHTHTHFPVTRCTRSCASRIKTHRVRPPCACMHST